MRRTVFRPADKMSRLQPFDQHPARARKDGSISARVGQDLGDIRAAASRGAAQKAGVNCSAWSDHCGRESAANSAKSVSATFYHSASWLAMRPLDFCCAPEYDPLATCRCRDGCYPVDLLRAAVHGGLPPCRTHPDHHLRPLNQWLVCLQASRSDYLSVLSSARQLTSFSIKSTGT